MQCRRIISLEPNFGALKENKKKNSLERYCTVCKAKGIKIYFILKTLAFFKSETFLSTLGWVEIVIFLS